MSTAHGFGGEGSDKDDHTRNVLKGAHIVEKKETQKESRGFARGAGNGHG